MHAGPNMSTIFPGTDGGRPMMLDGSIVLCTHLDTTFSRHYNGGIAHLSIYDAALAFVDVRALFNQVGKLDRRTLSSTPVAGMDIAYSSSCIC